MSVTGERRAMHYVYLGGAIVFEVIATSFLKAASGFKLWPTVIVTGGYIASFWLLSLSLQKLPLGLAYAVWAGVGVVLVAAVGIVVYREKADLAGIAGIAFIVFGVILLNAFSGMARH